MKSLVGAVFLLLFILLLEVMYCEGCWKQEREALIALNSHLGTLAWAHNINSNTDCCEWEGVECNTTTGRVTKLTLLPRFEGPWQLNYSDFAIFKDLKTLDLSDTYTSNCTGTYQGLNNLEVLDLSDNGFKNAIGILSCVEGLSSLNSLSLAGSYWIYDFQTVLETISSKLLHLEILKIGNNDLTNEILPSLRGFKSLKELHLNDNGLDSDLHFQVLCASLKNLEILDLSNNKENLDIFNNKFSDTDIASALSGLSSLKRLNLAGSKLTMRSIHNISKLRSLEILDLSWNNLNSWPPGLSTLTSLKILHFSNNQLVDLVGDWSKLKKLEELDLSHNEFDGKLPSSFFNLTSLRTLTLTDNHFIGNIGPTLASLTSLEYLNFEGNQLEFPISFTQFSNHSNLKFIYGNGNSVILDSHSNLKTWVPKFQLQVLQLSSITHAKSIPFPNFILYQYNLTSMDLTGWNLRGEFPNWLLENNTKMEMLILQNCSFFGDFHLPSHPHLNMVEIDVSDNAITCQMLNNNISSIFPNLVHLNMSKNAIHGSIPHELSHLRSLEKLDLSNNLLSGEIPPLLSMTSPLRYLLLDDNNLSGTIPIHFFNSSTIQNVDISNNNLIGNIPSQINCIRLSEISMSNNHFEGSIPIELAELESIIYLDLSQNNLSGCVPSFLHSFASFIHLNNNNLSCLSKNMFSEGSPLVTLDLSNNEIIDGIHDLIHDLHYIPLQILILKGNHFTGNIPKQLCELINLNILDLSCNNFFGEIPNCLGKMPFENKDLKEPREPTYRVFQDRGYLYSGYYLYSQFKKEKENFTSKNRVETYSTNILMYMSGIDLSQNKLNGSIPYEFGNLTRIRSLNLSNNFFTGKIPETFSNLIQVESLDLSFNMLSGRIPPQLTELTSLEVFSVAHKNLSGATPEWKGQFSTFDESSYEGNQFLCGPSLPKSCNPSGPAPTTLPNGLNNDGENDSWVDMYVFRVSFVVAYTSIVMVIPTVLYINPYWRQAWFYYIGLVCMNCYYFIEDNLYKFF